ncbi:hypothetical protein ACVWYF_003637 [Hymenobacter sp. UYAg731]
MMTDSEKLDKILENQELIIKQGDTNAAILNVFLDVLTHRESVIRKQPFDAAKADVLKWVNAYKGLIEADRGKTKEPAE